MNEHEIIDHFLKAMADAGIRPVFKSGQGIQFGLSPGGKPWRFHVEGDSRGSRNGWYVLFADGVPAGEFGSWKSGHRQTWCAKGHTELSDAERRAIVERMEAARIEREESQREREGEAARCANLVWQDAEEVQGDAHPYLRRKGVTSHGLRKTSWPMRNKEGDVYRHIDDTLLIPVADKRGKIISLQAVFPATDSAVGRDKDFMKDGKKAGGFFMIGRPPVAGGTIAVVEGYATAATVHALTGWCVIVAFDAYNMVAVSKAMREAFPACVFVIVCDNDQWTKTPVENPGVTYGKRAAAEINARVVIPEFADLSERPTDFNDLAQREGDVVAQSQLLPALPAKVEPAPNMPAPAAVICVDPIPVDSIDTWTPFPEIDGKGRPKPTIPNYLEMVNRLGVTVRYNMIAKRIQVLIPGSVFTIDNGSNAALAILGTWCTRFGLGRESLQDALLVIAEANQYNPVATWIMSTPWDGQSRLAEFYDTITAEKDRAVLTTGASMKQTLMRKWLISAVAAAFEPEGVVAKGVLTFTGKQNAGKTFWAKRLAPKDLRVVKDGVLLNPADRDSVKKCVSAWIVELGEVDATFNRSDLAAIKAFVSQDVDELRLPYARAESEFARRTVFFASVNDEKFLRDPTGNTRWWTIHVAAINNQHTIDVQQLWAEVLELYRAGETWHLTKDEADTLDEHNKDHEALSPIHERIDRAFDWESMQTLWNNPMTATEIVTAAGYEHPNKMDINAAAAYVTRTYGVAKVKKGKARSTCWVMPPRLHERKGSGPL